MAISLDGLDDWGISPIASRVEDEFYNSRVEDVWTADASIGLRKGCFGQSVLLEYGREKQASTKKLKKTNK